MRKTAVFYHSLFYLKDRGAAPLPRAWEIIKEQMQILRESRLLDACDEFHVGINGGEESKAIAKLAIPMKAQTIFHGLESRAENLTIIMIEEWVKTHPDWNVLYFHSKGATHTDEQYSAFTKTWRDTMMKYLVRDWWKCIADLQLVESVGCHWMQGMADGTQNLWAGNFWWATSDFLATVPTMFLRDRIKESGIAAAESRFEAEVWIGNGRLPTVKQYLPNGGEGVP